MKRPWIIVCVAVLAACAGCSSDRPSESKLPLDERIAYSDFRLQADEAISGVMKLGTFELKDGCLYLTRE